MKNSHTISLSCAACLCALCASTQAASLNFSESGDVLGIDQLVIDGNTYNATFFAGTYNELLAAYPSDTTLYDDNFAGAASQALFDFAITDNGFDGIEAAQINGCGTINCYMSTTVGQNSLTAYFFYFYGEYSSVGNSNYHIFPDDNVAHQTHVVWEAVSPVPVPASVWLFGSGLIGLTGIARARKRA